MYDVTHAERPPRTHEGQSTTGRLKSVDRMQNLNPWPEILASTSRMHTTWDESKAVPGERCSLAAIRRRGRWKMSVQPSTPRGTASRDMVAETTSSSPHPSLLRSGWPEPLSAPVPLHATVSDVADLLASGKAGARTSVYRHYCKFRCGKFATDAWPWKRQSSPPA